MIRVLVENESGNDTASCPSHVRLTGGVPRVGLQPRTASARKDAVAGLLRHRYGGYSPPPFPLEDISGDSLVFRTYPPPRRNLVQLAIALWRRALREVLCVKRSTSCCSLIRTRSC